MRKRVLIVLLAAWAAWSTSAQATPEASRWHRETLLGENRECFVRLVTDREQPGSYYSYVDTTRVQLVRKADLRSVEDSVVRVIDYSSDPDSESVWRVEESPQPPFDLGGYLRRHAIRNPWTYDRPIALSIDEEGVWVSAQGLRQRLLTRVELLRRVPSLGEEPHVTGPEFTDLDASESERGAWYFHVLSNTAAMDNDWSEHLLLVSGRELRAAFAALRSRLPSPKR